MKGRDKNEPSGNETGPDRIQTRVNQTDSRISPPQKSHPNTLNHGETHQITVNQTKGVPTQPNPAPANFQPIPPHSPGVSPQQARFRPPAWDFRLPQLIPPTTPSCSIGAQSWRRPFSSLATRHSSPPLSACSAFSSEFRCFLPRRPMSFTRNPHRAQSRKPATDSGLLTPDY